MNDLGQATETLVYEQQSDQTQTTAIRASRVGEDLDINRTVKPVVSFVVLKIPCILT